MQKWILTSFGAFLLSLPTAFPTLAIPSAYQTVSRESATQQLTEVQLESGRSTAIDFSAVGEQIIFVNLADPSRTVFTSNAPIQSGQATTLFLTPIQPLNFPGATTNPITNLHVQTIDSTGVQRLYSFNLRPVEMARYTGVMIQPEPVPRPQPQAALPTDVDGIERGLAIAIQHRYTAPHDPIVDRIRQVLTDVRQGLSLPQSAQRHQVPLQVLQALDELGTHPNLRPNQEV